MKILVFLLSLLPFAGPLAAEDNSIAWLGDYREALRAGQRDAQADLRGVSLRGLNRRTRF